MPAPTIPVGRIATITANGGATVTADHDPVKHAIRVKCTRHGLLHTDLYTTSANSVEVDAYCRYAGIGVQMHAAGCTKQAKR